jgi:hypothetical protein
LGKAHRRGVVPSGLEAIERDADEEWRKAFVSHVQAGLDLRASGRKVLGQANEVEVRAFPANFPH